MDYTSTFPSALPEGQIPPNRGKGDLFSIKLKEGALPPVKQYRRMNATHIPVLKEHINELIRMGGIVPSSSEYGAPMVFARKADGTTRPCVDYRTLNLITVKDKYPLPTTDMVLGSL